MAGVENGLPSFLAGNHFVPNISHPDITFLDHDKTAVITNVDNDAAQCVIGNNVYNDGQHDVRMNLSYLPPGFHAWIGMTGCDDPPLNAPYPHEGLSGWSVNLPHYVEQSGVILFYNNLGKPWQSGDKIDLHLDLGTHTLRLHHLRSGKSHTIRNVNGPQRLFIAMTTSGTAISLVNSN